MRQTIPLWLLAALTMSGCASGIDPFQNGLNVSSTPKMLCTVDSILVDEITRAPATLPEATAGDLATLRQNREDSKDQYQALRRSSNALVKQVAPCLEKPPIKPRKE